MDGKVGALNFFLLFVAYPEKKERREQPIFKVLEAAESRIFPENEKVCGWQS